MRWLALPAIAAVSLTACTTGLFDDQAPAGSVCPRLVTYGPDFLAQAAVELAALPEGTALEVLIHDYLVTRDQLRECQ